MRPSLWTGKTLYPWRWVFAFNWMIARICLQLLLIKALINMIIGLCGYPRLRQIVWLLFDCRGVAVVLIFNCSVLHWSLFWKAITLNWRTSSLRFPLDCSLLVCWVLNGGPWFAIIESVWSLICIHSRMSERILVVVVVIVNLVQILHSFLVVKRLILKVYFKLVVLLFIIIVDRKFCPWHTLRLRHGNFNFLASLDRRTRNG